MTHLKCSQEEAESVYEYDRKVEQAKESTRLEYDISAGQKEVERKMARTGTRKTVEKKAPTVYKLTKRNTTDEKKEAIIANIHAFLAENDAFELENLTIFNKTRQINFSIGDEQFTLVLTRKNK